MFSFLKGIADTVGNAVEEVGAVIDSYKFDQELEREYKLDRLRDGIRDACHEDISNLIKNESLTCRKCNSIAVPMLGLGDVDRKYRCLKCNNQFIGTKHRIEEKVKDRTLTYLQDQTINFTYSQQQETKKVAIELYEKTIKVQTEKITESDENNINYQIVLKASKSLESKLSDIGAIGKGIHEKTSSLTETLTDAQIKKLRYIATIRNKLVHDSEFRPSNNELSNFETAVEEMQTALDAIGKAEFEQ